MNPPAAVVNTFWWGVNSAFAVPVDALPVALVARPSRVAAALLALFGGSLVGIGIGAAFMLFREGTLGPGAVAGLGVFVLLSTPILLVGLHLLVKRSVTTLDEAAVRWDTRTLFKRASREEPIGSYSGVIFRTVEQRDSEGTQVQDVLELAHADPANVVRVFKAPAGRPIAAHWAAYCDRFELAAIEDITPRYRITRDPQDLETPLIELARRGRIALPGVPQAPPATLGLRRDGGVISLQLSDDHRIQVTALGLTDVSVRRSRRVGAAARWKGIDAPGDGGLFYAAGDIDAFTVVDTCERKPSVVMTVRQRFEAGVGPRVERRRIHLHVDESLDACIWLHAVLLRAVALGIDLSVTGQAS